MSSESKRPRGRPKQYDRDQALLGALGVFWRNGMDATSFDDLVAAMGMNRPSIYRAFGNKEVIYRDALALFRAGVISELDSLLASDAHFWGDMERFMANAVDVYCGDNRPLGCFIACTVAADVVVHQELKPDLQEALAEIDRKFELRCIRARDDGELDGNVDAKLLGQVFQGLLHTLAVRARAGQSKVDLNALKSFSLGQWKQAIGS